MPGPKPHRRRSRPTLCSVPPRVPLVAVEGAGHQHLAKEDEIGRERASDGQVDRRTKLRVLPPLIFVGCRQRAVSRQDAQEEAIVIVFGLLRGS